MRTKAILQKIKRDYSKIADEFDASRMRPWPEFEEFRKYIKKNLKVSRPKVLDVGCGNGRLARFLKHERWQYVGIDNNKNLIAIARKNNPSTIFRYGDMRKLPSPASSFDVVFCIAVLHHLPTKILQLKALKEIKRVLKKNGLFAITVWNLWQKKYKKYIDRKTHHTFIPWGRDKKTQRFYYAFTLSELKKLLLTAGFNPLPLPSTRSPQPHNLSFICHEKN